MQLDDFVLTITTFQAGRLQIEFFGQILQIFGATPVILGDNLVAGAVIANGVAEGDVEV